MRTNIQRRRGGSPLVLDLQVSPVWRELSPEQLQAVARRCKPAEILLDKSGRPLEREEDDDLACGGRVVFIADGLFERVFYPDQTAIGSPELAVVLNELKPGDIWGEHFLFESDPERQARIGLRSSGSGRVLRLTALEFDLFLNRFPEVRKGLCEVLAQREFDGALRLGAARASLERSEAVLSRLEGMTDMLMDFMAGRQRRADVIQRRFLLQALPMHLRGSAKTTEIEQAYLSSARDKEDRIRLQGGEYQRSTKVGVGLQRQIFERQITRQEYADLKSKAVGDVILKDRIRVQDDSLGKTIAIDRFKGKFKGLLIAEIDFDSVEEAEAFVLPEALLEAGAREVTSEKGYSNYELSLHGRPSR